MNHEKFDKSHLDKFNRSYKQACREKLNNISTHILTKL